MSAMQAVVTGNIVDGFVLYGPLKEWHTVDWLANNFDEWNIVDIHPLEEN